MNTISKINKDNDNDNDNNDRVIKLIDVLEKTNQIYAECFESPYYSGYSVYKHNKKRSHFSSSNRGLSKRIPYDTMLQIQGTDRKHNPIVIPQTRDKVNNHLLIKEENMVKITKETEKKMVHIDQSIHTINDLIELCEKYPLDEDIQYNINMEALHEIKEPLQQMDHMIGLTDIKSNLVDQVLYYVQELHITTSSSIKSDDFMHTVIYGPPGTGKTEIAKIIGNIFSKIGVLQNKVFKKVTRDDLIAGYLGQTAIKTKEIIKECIGGVLFIDEVYSLGNAEKRDSFSKECIDTLCEALSDHKGDLMCIIAGYKEEIKDCFFNVNDGLESRFPWQYNIEEYSADELLKIFHKKVKQIGWKLDHDIDKSWFHDNIDNFKYYGRDMETLLSKVKIAHSKRVFCLPKERKTIITETDINNGFQNFIKSDTILTRSSKANMTKSIHNSMYV